MSASCVVQCVQDTGILTPSMWVQFVNHPPPSVARDMVNRVQECSNCKGNCRRNWERN